MNKRYLIMLFTLSMSCNLISLSEDEPTKTTGTTTSNNGTSQNNSTNNASNQTTNGGTNNGTDNNTTNQNNTTNNSSNNTTNTSTGTTTTQSNNMTNGDYKRLVSPAGDYFGSPEKFSSYYTNRNWKPKRVLYVAMDAGPIDLDSHTYDSPMSMAVALVHIRPGDLVFVKKTSVPAEEVNIRLTETHHGTQEDPIVFYGERNADGTLGVHFKCVATGASNASNSCFNLERSNYIAIDGFVFEGGTHAVRTVGNFDNSAPQRGTTVINSRASLQFRAAISSGKSDWLVVESNVLNGAYGANGHGIYLGNGSDYNVIRYNEIYESASADIQFSGDPTSSCSDIELSDIECHGSAKDGNGKGVVEFFTISDNFFHNGNGQGPNFSSMKNSKISNNIFGPYALHGISFYQITDEPKLGSSGNEIDSNLIVVHRGHMLQFVKASDANKLSNNIMLAVNQVGTEVDATIQIVQTDNSIRNNTYTENFYFTGTDLGHALGATETYSPVLPPDLFPNAPFARTGHPEDWTPKEGELGGWLPPILAPFPSPYSR